MRFKKPKYYEYRYVTKFLWFPKRFDGLWVWLETVTIRQMYCPPSWISGSGWTDVCLSNPNSGLPISIDPIKTKQR
jgi:hypothetical protein